MTLHEKFSEIVKLYPEQIALSYHQYTMTYRELDIKSTQLAIVIQKLYTHYEKKQCLPNTLIGLHVRRGFNLIISILGILKSGAAYVALPFDYPSARLKVLAEEANLNFIITEKDYAFLWNDTQKYHAICIDTIPDELNDLNTLKNKTYLENDLAYVLFTSGSTGKPKGVQIQHKSVMNLLDAQKDIFQVQTDDRMLQFADIGFDPSVWEWTTALLNGATLVLTDSPSKMTTEQFISLMEEKSITIASIPPVLLQEMMEIFIKKINGNHNSADRYVPLPTLRSLIVGGEVCSAKVLDFWSKNRRVFNTYGPTEATVFCIFSEYSQGDSARQIGYPINGVKAYILDDSLQQVAQGEVGELYLSGECLSIGYLNEPKLTSENFLNNSFVESKNTVFKKLYRTGDIVKLNEQGKIEYVGRNDSQVKIRGMRVELSEIKHILDKHPMVKNSVVLSDENKKVIGFFEIITDPITFFTEQENQLIDEQMTYAWQHSHNDLYKTARNINDKSDDMLDITGWKSNYTKKQFTQYEMQEWRDNTVERILALKPKRILEIGCGSGMLLFKIAPFCEKYVATDFSNSIIDNLQRKVIQKSLNNIVKLKVQNADMLDKDYIAGFDMVIINSVIQYFPSQAYLTSVIMNALKYIESSGTIFVGDVRSYMHFELFCALSAFYHCKRNKSTEVLQREFKKCLNEDHELLVHHDYFGQFDDQLNEIDYVEFNLKKGEFLNEMNQFRYDAILHIEKEVKEEKRIQKPVTLKEYLWPQVYSETVNLRELLNNKEIDILIIKNIPNHRLKKAKELLEKINQVEPLVSESTETLKISELFKMAELYNYDLNIFWSKDDPHYCVDACFSRKEAKAQFLKDGYKNSLPIKHENYSVNTLTNNPSTKLYQSLVKRKIHSNLRNQLPGYMADIELYAVNKWPMTVNNKIDCKKLLRLKNEEQQKNFASFSTDPTEKEVFNIWKELLDSSNFSLNDSFFDVGGHSLLAVKMLTRLNQHFKLDLNLQTVVCCPTVKQIAKIVQHAVA